MSKETKVFMLNDATDGDSRLAMDHIYSVEKHVAERLETEGKAIKFDGVPELDRIDREISNLVGRFKKDYEKMENSKDPRYSDPEFFAEEAGKLRKELDEQVEALQAEYAETVRATKDEAHRARANLTRNITPDDEKGARQLMNELVGEAKLNGIDEAIERIESDMKYYSEGRKAAIANELYRLVDLVDEDDRNAKRSLRSLSNRLREDTEGVELGARIAAALPDTTGTDYNRLKLIHRAYKGRWKI